MSLESFFDRRAVIPDLNGEGILDVIEEGSRRLKEVYNLDISADEITRHLFHRERLGSTGVGEGVAFPHARVPGVDRVCGLLGISHRGVDFKAEDGKPVHIFFFLIGPEKRPADLLQALATASKLLRQKKVRQKLLSTKEPEKIYEILLEEERKLEKE